MTTATAAPHWTDIDGWLTPHEGDALRRFAEGKRVLEIGSFCGRSTVAMAQVAASVTCIDPFDGRGTAEQRDTRAEFCANLERFGVADKVTIHQGTTQQIAPALPAGTFDRVFIDGAHDRRSVLYDYAQAVRLLAPGGGVAFHDYGDRDPGVISAVNTILADGARMMELSGSVAVVRPVQCGMIPAVPFLAIPTHDGTLRHGTHLAACAVRQRFPLASEMVGLASILTANFNNLYATALNKRAEGVTHFVMLHADIEPLSPAGLTWLDVLLTYMRGFNLGMISAAAPIKNDSGETSTALDAHHDGFRQRPIQRLTREQIGPVMLSDIAPDGRTLLANTGCMVIDITQPWAEGVEFSFGGGIIRGEDGQFGVEADPEDWRLSRWLHKQGVRYGVTTDVQVRHAGWKVYQ